MSIRDHQVWLFPTVVAVCSSNRRGHESHFVMEDWHNLAPTIITTLMAWHERFITFPPEIAGNYNERFKRMFSYYLNARAGAFRARDIQLSAGGIYARRAEKRTARSSLISPSPAFHAGNLIFR